MANSKGAVVFLAIIAVAGLGLSGYLLVDDLFLGGDEYEGLKLVGLWNYLEKNVDTPQHSLDHDFLIAYSEGSSIDENYVNVINETRFTLPISGLYKITLNVMFEYIDPGETYAVALLQNNAVYEWLDYFETANPIVENFHFTKISFYVNSTGGDSYYEFNSVCTNPVDFQVYPTSDYNQLFIEFLT